MKKVRLDLDALRVDSFSTAELAEGRGTVRGLSIIEPSGFTYCIPCGGGGGGESGYDCSHTCQNSVCCAPTPNTACEM